MNHEVVFLNFKLENVACCSWLSSINLSALRNGQCSFYRGFYSSLIVECQVNRQVTKRIQNAQIHRTGKYGNQLFSYCFSFGMEFGCTGVAVDLSLRGRIMCALLHF